MPHPALLLTRDGRNRVSLGALARYGTLHSHYLAVLEADGTIVLKPAAVMPLERSHELHRAERNLRSAKIELLDDDPRFQ